MVSFDVVSDSFVIFLDSSQFDLFLIAMDRFSFVCSPWPSGCGGYIDFNGEFDPGSGRTLAACLTHASRAVRPLRGYTSGERVSNT